MPESKNYIDVTYDNGNPAKMLHIFFGTVLIETPSGSKFWIRESQLDHDWRRGDVTCQKP
jgi:hypothetical protein